MVGLENDVEKLIMKVIGVVVILAVAGGLVGTVHSAFTNFIANLTSATMTTASVIAGVIEAIFWILIVLSVLKIAFKTE